jgi:hypothetical protein
VIDVKILNVEWPSSEEGVQTGVMGDRTDISI